MSKNAEQIIEQAPRIPSLPAVAVRVLELTRTANTDLREMAELIENDQGLAAKVIRTVNSSFYGLSKPCGTISQALIYLGLDAVRTLALGFSLVESIDGGGEHDVAFDYVAYWRRAIHSAAAARELAALARTCDPDEAFLAALLQDVGMIALNRAFGDRYLQAIDMAGECHHRLVEIERQSLEVDHAEMGAALAARWNLPPQHIEAIRCHHNADIADESFKGIVQIAELAGCAAEAATASGGHPPAAVKKTGTAGEAVARFRTLAKRRLGLTPSQADTVLKVMANRAVELAWLLRVEMGRGLDVEAILSQAEDLRTEREVTMMCSDDRSEQDAGVAGTVSPGDHDAEHFECELARLVESARAASTPLTFLFGEVDRLATIIETVGRPAAESLIREVQSRLKEHMSDGGLLFPCSSMLGGFAALIPGMDRMGAAREAEMLRRCIESQPIELSEANARPSETVRLSVTMSFGAAVMDSEMRPHEKGTIDDAETLRGLADLALKAARAAGKNSVRVYNPTAPKKCAA